MMEFMEMLLSLWFLLADNGFVGGMLTMSIGMLVAWIFSSSSRSDRSVEVVKVHVETQTEITNMPLSRGPEKIYTTRTGECFHVGSCGHIRHHVTQSYRRCRDCIG